MSEPKPTYDVAPLKALAIDQEHIDRFWEKVDKSAPCWLWRGALNEKGYGVAWDGRRTQRAHRLSYALKHGYMPDLCVLHMCDVPNCVNPDHLFLGTRADNNADMHRKGRDVPGGTYSRNYKIGTAHPGAKMTESRVRQLRRDYATGGYSYSQLSRKYSLSQGHTYRIVNKEVWKHVD